MARFILRRVAGVLPAALLASLAIFLVMHVLPGDVALSILADTPHTLEMREALREELGLNDPLAVQYGRWLWSMLTGRFGGESLGTGQEIATLLAEQLPVTLLLASYALVISLVVSMPLGVIAAAHKGRPLDLLIRILGGGGLSLPGVWLALVALLLLLRAFSWSPPIIYFGPVESLRDHLGIMIVPALLLAWEHGAHVMRAVRAATRDALRQPFSDAARARGVPELDVRWRHAARHALSPGIAVAAVEAGGLLGATLVFEIIFGLPGVGRGMVQAALARDYPYVQSVGFLLVVIYLFVALAGDLVAQLVDPRVRAGAVL